MRVKEKPTTIDTPLTSKTTKGRKAGAVYFPRNSLLDALRVAKSIWNDNAGRPFAIGDLASKLNYSPTSGNFRDLLRSAERYGLTEGTWVQDTTKTIALSNLGMSIVAPKVDEDPNTFMRKALETPDVFRGFLNSINGRVVPPSDVCASTLIREFHVLREDVDACCAVLMKNIEELKLSQDSTQGKQYLRLDKLSTIQLTSPTAEEEEPTSEEVVKVTDAQSTSIQPEIAEKQIPKQIFVAHGKNRKPLEQLEKILKEYDLPYKVAVNEPHKGRPISTKVADLMRSCTHGIFIFTGDEETEDSKGNTILRPNDNVVYELGAASVLYGDKIIIFRQDGVSFGSDFSDLGYITFEKDELDAKGLDLLKELKALGFLKFTLS